MLDRAIFYATQYGPQLCLSWMPQGDHRELYAAIVCGIDLPANETRQLFIDSGLIHILVVSGAHLAYLDSYLTRRPQSLRMALLTAYCWLTGWGAPVVRSLIRRFATLLLASTRLSVLQMEAVAALGTLVIVPAWIFSRSFQMSWMCALAIAVAPQWRFLPHLSVSGMCFVFLFPYCAHSPFGILANVLMVPVIGGVLFPLSVLASVIPPISMMVDQVWVLTIGFLQLFPLPTPLPWYISGRQLFWLPFLVHGFLLLVEVPWRRRLMFSSV